MQTPANAGCAAGEVSPPIRARMRIDDVEYREAFSLPAQPKAFDDRLVTTDILALELVLKPAALTDHREQAAPRVVVMPMSVHMAC